MLIRDINKAFLFPFLSVSYPHKTFEDPVIFALSTNLSTQTEMVLQA